MLHSVGLKTHTVPPGASNQQISQKFSKLPCTLPSATSGNMISQKKYSEHSARALWCASGEMICWYADIVWCAWRGTLWVLFQQPLPVDFQKEEAITVPDSTPFTHYVNHVKKIHIKIVISSLLLYKRSGEISPQESSVFPYNMKRSQYNWTSINTEIQCHID